MAADEEGLSAEQTIWGRNLKINFKALKISSQNRS